MAEILCVEWGGSAFWEVIRLGKPGSGENK